MSKNRRRNSFNSSSPGLAASKSPKIEEVSNRIVSGEPSGWTRRIAYLKNHWWAVGLIALLVLGVTGAGLKFLEEDAARVLANRKTVTPLNQPKEGFLASVNPFLSAPTPTPTPQLSKEYIYAGSRLLAVEDANANAAPPADLAVWRPSSGWWYVLGGPGSATTYYQWGATGDTAVPGDFDGDGKTDFSVFRPSTGVWWIATSSNNSYMTYQFGVNTDVPAPADYDGDGRTDAAVFRNGTWYILRSSDGGVTTQAFGLSSDTPAAADYDGDGKADLAVWRAGSPGTFYVLRSGNGQLQTAQLGQTGDLPVPGDYDGDGKSDFAIRSGANWNFVYSANGQNQTVGWQQSGDKAVQNDYDGDGKVDIAVWRPTDTPAGTLGHWYIRKSGSANALREEAWGMSGDIPVPAFYRR